MQTITEQQRQSLETIIYSSIMANPEFGMGEMGEARDEANRIVSEWMEENDIEELDKETKVIFLFEEDNETIFAYFPEIPSDNHNMTCYAHLGQHSACCAAYTDGRNEATKTEYADLLLELIGQGYNNLTILNKDK